LGLVNVWLASPSTVNSGSRRHWICTEAWPLDAAAPYGVDWLVVMDSTTPVSTIDEVPVEPEDVPDGVDPRSMLRPKMRVLGAAGRALGRVDTLEYDAVTGYLNSLVVRHGRFGRTHTFITADRVTQINENSVMLQLSVTEFQSLPTVED
jgi:hypothetical protein